MNAKVHSIWQPQPGPQTKLIQCPVFEVFFGGARGGGKTESSLGDWLEHSSRYGKNAIGIFFRRKAKQLEEVIARSQALFLPLGAKFNSQKSEFTMPNGARLKFRYLERDVDAQEYQGHSYTRVYVEEATNFPSPSPINLLRGTLRSAEGVPTGMRLTGNPGGPGHQWVKSRYIDPSPKGYTILKEAFDNGVGGVVWLDRVFIPSKLGDNRLLIDNDPTYVARLRQTGSAALVQAWLEGLWDIVDGAFFEEFNKQIHVLDAAYWTRAIPQSAIRFRAFDWGSAKPFSCGWYAISDGTWGLPRNALFKYREWYGSKAPNVGLKMDAGMVAQGIVEREKHERIKYGVADPSIFIRNGGPSIAEMMAVYQCMWRRADNKRIPGWEQLHCRLKGDGIKPMLYFADTCEDSIRTIPVLQHDEHNQEDIDTDMEDHAADETRYALMSRPWIPKLAPNAAPLLPSGPAGITINQLIKKESERRAQQRGVRYE